MSPSFTASDRPPNLRIIGSAYGQLKALVRRYAGLRMPVFFLGETGSGKELFAQYYMQWAKESSGERRTALCTGVPDELLHSFPPLQKGYIPILVKHFLKKSLKREVMRELISPPTNKKAA